MILDIGSTFDCFVIQSIIAEGLTSHVYKIMDPKSG